MIQSARAPATRTLYSYKWKVFERWCTERREDPFHCCISVILCFLHSLHQKGLSPSTVKVYLAAISACHYGIGGKPPGCHPLVSRFMQGVRRLHVPVRSLAPSWDLVTVLNALTKTPFEPLRDAELRVLSFKTALLVAIVSAKRVGNLAALSVHQSCLTFSPGNRSASLRPNPAFQPKVISAGFSSTVINLSAFCPPPFQSEEEERLHTLCPIRALSIYVDRTRSLRRSNQLFVCYGSRTVGEALSKERLSHWLVEAITLAYSTSGQVPPEGLRAHSIRGVATSWALLQGVSTEDVCAAASWATPRTFVRFYNLDMTESSVAHSVLSAARRQTL